MIELFDMSRVALYSPASDKSFRDGRAQFFWLEQAIEAAQGLVAAGLVSQADVAIKKQGASLIFLLSPDAEEKAVAAAREQFASFVTITISDDLAIEQWYSTSRTGELLKDVPMRWPSLQHAGIEEG